MGAACCDTVSIATPLGRVILEGPIKSEVIETLKMNNKLNNFRPPERQKEALSEIAGMPGGMVFAARNENEIVGYVTFHPPEGFSRWSKHPSVLELGCIEVSSDWRQCGIGEALLKEAFNNSVMEDFIVITIEFYWHWDLEGCGLGIFEYQKMLSNLFGMVGLKKRFTDDPDIMEHPANVLLARAGKRVGQEEIQLFENMLFERKKAAI